MGIIWGKIKIFSTFWLGAGRGSHGMREKLPLEWCQPQLGAGSVNNQLAERGKRLLVWREDPKKALVSLVGTKGNQEQNWCIETFNFQLFLT